MKYSENLSNIAAALANVQAEIKNPIKNNVNKGVQGAPKYANLEDTLAEYVRPVLSKHGMSVFQSIKSADDGRVGIATTLFHESGEYIESDYVFCNVNVPISKEGKKILTDGQATGVCITYLRRYSLNATLGINGDNDTDGSYPDAPTQEHGGSTASQSSTRQTKDGASISYEAALEFEITFGKYKGLTLRKLYKTDHGYVEWLLKSDKTAPSLRTALDVIEAEIAKAKAEKSTPKEVKEPEAVTVAEDDDEGFPWDENGEFTI